MECSQCLGQVCLSCAKVNDYNLETVEVTDVLMKAKEHSFLAVDCILLCLMKVPSIVYNVRCGGLYELKLLFQIVLHLLRAGEVVVETQKGQHINQL